MLGERTSALVSFEMQKLMAAAVIVSPYLPMLFMGEEYGEFHPFQYFVSHTDKELSEAVRKGRKAEFAAFHAEGEAPDPVSEETFNQSKLQWDLLNDEPHKTMFHYYHALIDLRKHELALKHLERKQLDAQANESDNTLLLRRWYEDEHVLCLMNFSKEQRQMQLPLDGNDWTKIFDSAEPKWKGPQASEESVSNGATITLQPESILIYSNQTTVQNV
jgi:maltooligosyltrehalose trehalohydrolase